MPDRRRSRSPGRPPVAELEARRGHLVDVAATEFLAHGYEGASMSRIARLAGVSPKTLYARYSGKDDLLLAVIGELLAESTEAVSEGLADLSVEPEEALMTCAMTVARHWTSEREVGLFRLVIAEAVRFPQLPALYQGAVEPFMRSFKAYLTAQDRRNVLAVDDVTGAAHLFAFATTGQLRQMALFGQRPSPAEVEQMVSRGVRLFLAGYRAKS